MTTQDPHEMAKPLAVMARNQGIAAELVAALVDEPDAELAGRDDQAAPTPTAEGEAEILGHATADADADADEENEETEEREQADPPRSVAGFIFQATEKAYLANTRRTYLTYWKVLIRGIRLYPDWSVEREQAYLATAQRIEAAKKLGVTVPTNPDARERAPDGSLIVVGGLGDKRLDAVGESDVRFLAKWVRLHAATNAALDGGDGDGKTAETHFIEAVRSLYRRAQGDHVVPKDLSPAANIPKPRRSPAPSQTMTLEQLEEVWQVCASTGNDPDLDALLFRFHYHTGARQAGAINLTLGDLDFDQQTVTLNQKGDYRHEVPVPLELMEDLVVFAAARGSQETDDPVFRQRRRTRGSEDPHPPLTRRRYNAISSRVRAHLRWAARAEWRPNWLRHQAAAEVAQIAGTAVKRELLGHAASSVTDLYGTASLHHVAWAIAQRTGEPHPLAERPPWL